MPIEIGPAARDLGARVRVVPRAYLATIDLRVGAYWERVMHVNGEHRRLHQPTLGDFSREEVEHDALQLDLIRVGSVIQVVDWNFSCTQQAKTVAFARLAGLTLNARHDVPYHVQVFQTIRSG